MNRKKFLQQISLAAGATLIPLGMQGWALRSWGQTNHRQRLIVVFLRGAADGLNVVVPYQETAYYEARPNIAIPQPGQAGGAIDLDGQFGLHPALKPLMSLWRRKQLAFIQACGSHDTTRSHFDAQLFMENGTPGMKTTGDGWLNRLLANLPKGRPTQAVNVGEATPHILKGNLPVAYLPRGKKSQRPLPLDRPQINQFFDRLYSNNDPLSIAYQGGREAREIVFSELQSEMMAADGGAPPPSSFAHDARNLARLMVGDAKTQLAFLSLGRWDTHANQGGSQGQLAYHLQHLATGLTTLVRELGSVFGNTTIVVMSEFGRTVRENGNRGTDHGHGNVMWLLGGNVRGGKVYGQWPGLEEGQLYQGRDLAITTDFREAIALILTQQMQINSNQVAEVFPGYHVGQSSLDFFG